MVCAIFVVVHDPPVFLLVLQDLEVGEEVMVAKRLGAVIVQLVDFLVPMIGLVQCVVILIGQSELNATSATPINLATPKVVLGVGVVEATKNSTKMK